ncbi:uncharacterized protein LOC130891756 isoform X13 [Diorhabda carinulata]|uniref:uncharacterized protein LOC130891756 isoform X13 n=1 Tax=Diorhabda carinulata TaxID=1163345 RepID=UPI0025A086A2|nr:uncharacterized protein LOC130891756 isoform X13 [Diorhabda carinulata]
MIGSFWNLCRACPSMPVDKLHSEYRSTYRWHEYTGPRQEVVRRPPQTNVTEKSNDISAVRNNEEDSYSTEAGHKPEPAMPRRKKYPDLAYRHHEFIVSDGTNDFDSADRARGKDGSLLRKAISKLSTEYRLQFAWPQGHTSRREAAGFTPRKSHSMGALKARAQANAMVHKNRIHLENKDASELEPLVDEGNNRDKCRESFHSEYKKNYRPFSQYEYTERGFSSKRVDPIEEVQKHLESDKNSSWYREVVELRKKAGEYKHREWGSDLAPERLTDIYNKQIELWDQVSRRSSLSALSLASMTHKNYTKEEKDDDNNRKSSPTKAYRNAENSVRMIRDIIRHHLERTTGGSEMDGLILSPTREKLEPTIPRKDDDSRGSQKNSPKKSSPMKSSSLKRTNQKAKQGGPKKLRSQSVGPTTESSVEKRSPKRQSRSTTAKEGRKSSSETPSNKRPRPSDETKTDAVENKDTSTNEEYDSLTYEPVIKSPPEPTRVKSPEQIIMRSPDPVNWTVPLDTGKTFTVTQNVREGDLGSRPHSEVKVWTPPDIPPPVAQSAPPTLIEQSKEPAGLS